jgi:hypothetical protein
MSPLSRCNAARASFVLREDFEALLNATREEPDQTPLEQEMLADIRDVKRRWETDDAHVDTRDIVEARIVDWALSDLDAVEEPIA